MADLFDEVVAPYTAIEGGDVNQYPDSEELLSISASYSDLFNLMRLGIHHERLPPGRRLCWPHAEADEEEFVFVIEGTPDLWLDGHVKRLKPGDGVSFRAGTGFAHTFLNNTDTEVRVLVVGEASRRRSRVHYPLHPRRNAEIGGRHWKDAPARPLGPHDCIPDKAR
jgi:uncharacterized cupin superfamily protein